MRFLPLLFLLGIVTISCNKGTKEWEQYQGFALDDIKGTYHYSNVANAFESLTESDYCHICEDAVVNISSYLNSETSIEFKVNCPSAVLNKSFTGRPAINEDGILLNMAIPATSPFPNYELTAYVYKNDKGIIRLHGFARHIIYEIETDANGNISHWVKAKINYYFDVIKD